MIYKGIILKFTILSDKKFEILLFAQNDSCLESFTKTQIPVILSEKK
jgi:hypothetical protein